MRIIDKPDLQVPPSLGLEDVSPSGQESGKGMSHLYQTSPKLFLAHFYVLEMASPFTFLKYYFEIFLSLRNLKIIFCNIIFT